MNYTMKWHSYGESIGKLFQKTLSSQALTDVVLICERNEIHGHKLVLSAMSLYFEELILVHPEGKLLVSMFNIHFDVLKSIVDYMYSGVLYMVKGRVKETKELLQNLKVRGFVEDYERMDCDSEGGDSQGRDSQDADSQDADSQDADSQDADLQDADLQDADLQDADLQDADLQDADLQDADLQDADLQDADLQDADSQSSIILYPQTAPQPDINQSENHSESTEVKLPQTISLLQPRMSPFQKKLQEEECNRKKKLKETEISTAEQPVCSTPKPKILPSENVNPSTSVSLDLHSSEKYAVSNNPRQGSDTIEVTKKCIFCEGHRRGEMIQVSVAGRELLKKEIQNNDDGIYQKLLDYEEIYMHGKCRSSYCSSPPPSCSKQQIKRRKMKGRKKLLSSTSESDDSGSNASMELHDSSGPDVDSD